MRAQTAVDFLATYGIALMIITISVGVAYQIGISSNYIFSPSCTPMPGFSCEYYSLDSNGILTMTIAQATGGDIIVRGVACSSAINSTGGRPRYGNAWVSNSFRYYPYATPGGGIRMASGSKQTFYLYCYNGGGVSKPASRVDSYIGFIWLNYSIVGAGVNVTTNIASIQMKYT